MYTVVKNYSEMK